MRATIRSVDPAVGRQREDDDVVVDLVPDVEERGPRPKPAGHEPTSRRRLSPRGGAPAPIAGAAQAGSARIVSVDALRGFAVCWIIAGDAFAWALQDMVAGKQGAAVAVVRFVSDEFKHATWEGLRFYDFLFPLFIFVMGVSIVFSLSRLVEREGVWTAHKRVLVRSLLLFALGLIYYGGASNMWPDIRLLGVLQRIALCYLFASLLFLHLDVRGLVVAAVALLAGYWALMTFVPVPGVGAGSFAKEANLARWLDVQYLPSLRLYGDWDPEGLLSTLPAIASCLIGVFAGMLLVDARIEPPRKALWLVGGGVALVFAGHLWALHFPIIKMIWTSSFVLVTGGYSMALLGLCYLLIDVRGHVGATPLFVWFGANPILLYMINNMAGFRDISRKLVGGQVEAFLDATVSYGTGSLVISIVGLILASLLARYFYRRGILVRI